MRKVLSFVVVIGLSSMLISGCEFLGSKENNPHSTIPEAPSGHGTIPETPGHGTSPSKPEDERTTIDKDEVRFIFGKDVRYFDGKYMQGVPEGKQYASLYFGVINMGLKPLIVDPQYLTVITDKNNSYPYSPAGTDQAGGLKATDLERDFEGGGLVLFEIPVAENVVKVQYKDPNGLEVETSIKSNDQTPNHGGNDGNL